VSKKGIAGIQHFVQTILTVIAQLYHTQVAAARTQLPGPAATASFPSSPLQREGIFCLIARLTHTEQYNGIAAALDHRFLFISMPSLS